MANTTTNYGLTQPLESEFYDVGVQNGNMDIIDTQIKANADAIAALGDEVDEKATASVTGILKGVQSGSTVSVASATAGTDYQAATQKLTESADMDH